MRIKRRYSAALFGAVTAAALVISGAQASAQPAEVSDQQVVGAVDQAATAAGVEVGIGLDSATASVAQAGPASILLTSPTGQTATLSAADSANTRVVDGSAVADVPGGAKVVSEALPVGGKQSIAIADSSAPTRYTFNLGLPAGLRTELAPDGGVSVVADAEDAEIVVGSIAAPWAVDAAGNSVPTSFEVAGNTVTQVVEHAGAVYPVTADPLFTFGTSIYLNITGAQAIGVKNLFTAVAIGGVAAGCSRAFSTALGKGGTLGKLAAAIVSGLCLYGGKDAVQALISSLNDPAGFDPGACYQKDIFKGNEGFVTVDASNCQ